MMNGRELSLPRLADNPPLDPRPQRSYNGESATSGEQDEHEQQHRARFY